MRNQITNWDILVIICHTGLPFQTPTPTMFMLFNLQVMLGNRYGFQPFPVKINSEEFEHFLSIAKEMDLPDLNLLHEWFLRDNNALLPEYLLQPIGIKLPYFNAYSEEHKQLRKEAKQTWSEIKDKILAILRICANVALERNLITAEVHAVYFQSVTGEEIYQGLQTGKLYIFKWPKFPKFDPPLQKWPQF